VGDVDSSTSRTDRRNAPFARIVGQRTILVWGAVILSLCLLFVFDVLTPRGFEIEDLYVLLIFAIALFGKPRQVLIVASVGSVLAIVGFFLSPAGIATGWAIGNLALGIFIIWVTASLVLVTRNLFAANANLQIEIAQRRQAEEELKKALAVKDDFLGMVSHEMRTPLTNIIASTALLDDDEIALPEEEKAEILTEMRLSSERLAKTIDNMLALARMQAGRRIEVGAISLRVLIDEQTAQHLKRYQTRKINVSEDGALPRASGSADYVRHVISNLLENAEKYSPRQEPIEVELRREGREVVLRVLDRGVGVTEEEAEHIFEAFYRSPRVASGSSGMGIGLSVCKRLVEEQGGRIWAIPRLGGGSEFGFSLPVAPDGVASRGPGPQA
jgi:signal transduction histidine kinase